MAKCFIIMPISMLDIYADRYNDPEHFKHVLDYLHTPALEAAGYEAVPPTAAGSDLIQAEIIRNLETCDLVLCDISTLNPNVFFELGIRTSLDGPVALVRDNFTVKIPFDTGSINTHTYDASLQPWTLPSEVAALTLHIQQVAAKSGNRNALWRYFGLTQRASPADIADPTQAKLDLLIDEVTQLRRQSDIVSNPLPWVSSPAARAGNRYEAAVANALTGMGYFVRPTTRDIGFDFIVEDGSGRIIYAELKSYPGREAERTVNFILSQASKASVPVLLITQTELPAIAQSAISASDDSRKLVVVKWHDENDNDLLAETLRRMFASIPDSPRTATEDQAQ